MIDENFMDKDFENFLDDPDKYGNQFLDSNETKFAKDLMRKSIMPGE